jgi:adenosylcobinamide-phosphate synthase
VEFVAGFCADRLVGDPARGHPVAGFGRLAAGFEGLVWRPRRSAGLVYVLTLVGGVAVATGLLDHWAGRWRGGRLAFRSLVLWACLGGRTLEAAGDRLACLLETADLAGARTFLPTLAGRDPEGLDASEISRAAVESLAENTADAVTGPLVWGVLAGPVGMAAYRAANTLDAMVGHRNERYERFGWAAARLDDVLGWVPARLAAVFGVLLAPVVGGDRRVAWQTWRRDGGAHPSPNAGRVEAVFAGALEIRLGGTNRYAGRAEDRPILGDGRPAAPADLRRAVRLSRATSWASAGVAAVAAPVLRRGAVAAVAALRRRRGQGR